MNTAPVGSGAAVSEEMAFPSGSFAVTEKLTSVPSDPDTVAGAVTTGARSTFAIVIEVDAPPESAFEAVNVTL